MVKYSVELIDLSQFRTINCAFLSCNFNFPTVFRLQTNFNTWLSSFYLFDKNRVLRPDHWKNNNTQLIASSITSKYNTYCTS